jgi:hypothetical protein
MTSPGPQFLVIPNGQTVSSTFALPRGDGALVVAVPSYGTPASVLVTFTQTSGTGPFAPLQKFDGSGATWTAFSGTGGGTAVLMSPPTIWGRVELGASQSAVMTFTILERRAIARG